MCSAELLSQSFRDAVLGRLADSIATHSGQTHFGRYGANVDNPAALWHLALLNDSLRHVERTKCVETKTPAKLFW